MTDDRPIRVPDALYVNEATLELIQRRIEGEVRKSFFTWIGAPVGLAGIGAILYLLFSYIPANISSYLEKDPKVQEALRLAAEGYLKDPNRGQKFVREQVELNARDQVQAAVAEQVKATVAAYFADPQGGKKLVTTQISSAVDTYFGSTGKQSIQQQVNTFLTSAEGKQLVQEQVRRELEPRLAAVIEPMKNNVSKLVAVADRLPDVTAVEKGTIGELESFLQSPAGRQLQASSGPIALTKRIRRGPVYDPFAIDFYLETLQQRFGGRFQHVVIGDERGALLARIDPPFFRRQLRDRREPLMRTLNATPEHLTREQAQRELTQIFGIPVDAAIPQEWKVGRALRAPVWRLLPDGKTAVSVLGDQGQFIGVTSRDRLLMSVFGLLPG